MTRPTRFIVDNPEADTLLHFGDIHTIDAAADAHLDPIAANNQRGIFLLPRPRPQTKVHFEPEGLWPYRHRLPGIEKLLPVPGIACADAHHPLPLQPPQHLRRRAWGADD